MGGGAMVEADVAPQKQVEGLFTDMRAAQQQEIINVCFAALEKGGNDQEIAKKVKEEIEKKEHGAWHVIVGIDFGSHCTHEQSSLIALDISLPLADAPYRRHKHIMVFRHG